VHHIHIAGNIDGSLIATAVLVPEDKQIKMQRVVVSEAFRNSAIGSEMMKFCEQYAKSMGYQLLYCHARDSAVNFYKKNHYQAEGGFFDEDGIPHLKMSKAL
jgi:predicted GNAT family N-acyltransferase